MKRAVLVLASAPIVGALALVPAVRAPIAHAQSGECSSFPGYKQIEAEYGDLYVHSNGPAAAATVKTVGSCYLPQPRGTSIYGTTVVNLYTYDNQDNRCLYWNQAAGEIYTAANANGCSAQPNEEFFGYRDTGSGWIWYNEEAASDGESQVFAEPCANYQPVYEGTIPVPSNNCRYWNFPSDGGG